VTQSIGFEHKVLVAFAATAVAVAALLGTTWKLANDASDAGHWVAHTQDTLNQVAHMRTTTLQVELATQGFRVSGDPARLTERDASIALREAVLQQFKTQTSDNAVQQALWAQLRQVLDERLAISRRVEELRKTQGAEAANAFVATVPLQQTRERSLALLDRMDAEERQLLAQRQAQQAQARRGLVAAGVGVSLLLLVLLGATWWLVRRQLRAIERSRQALARSEENLATTLYSIGDAVLATDTLGCITRMNPVAERLTGWPLADAQGRPAGEVVQLVHELTGAPAELPVSQVLATGEVHLLANHTLLVARDGSRLPIADSAAPIRDNEGRVHGVVMVFRDETLARQAKRSIREQNARLEQRVQERTAQLNDAQNHLLGVINNVPALIAYVDAQQRYVYVNDQYRARFAPGLTDITGCTVQSVLGPERYAIAAPLIAQALQGQPQGYDWEPFPGVWQTIQYAPKRDDHGQVVGYYVLGTDITERRRSEQALQASEQRLARVLQGADEGYWDWDLQTNAFVVSPRWETMLGYAPGSMQVDTANWPNLVHPEDFPSALASIQKHTEGLTDKHEVEFRLLTQSGDWRWVRTSGRIVSRSVDGQPLLMSGTHTDIHQRKLLEFAQQEAAVVFDSSYEGIMMANAEHLITKVNPAFTRITGYEAHEVLGQSPHMLSSGRQGPAFYDAFWASVNEHGFWRGEIWNKRKSGEEFAVLQAVSAVHDPQGRVQHYVSVFTDISQIKAHELELDRVAHYDPLTQLPNRRLMSDRLQQSLIRAQRSGKLSAVCFLDLDGFKAINDLHGHAVGDQVLVGVADHLKSVLRADDTLARMGGDEFVLVSDVATAEECTVILDRVLHIVRQPVTAGDHVISLTASIGASLYPADNADPETLLRHADQAMYQAKQAGKNRYQLFDPEIDRQSQAHRAQLAELRVALDGKQLVLFYQPKVDLVSGEVMGVEALVRWQHPERGLLQPGEFLPAVYGSDLEHLLGEWVMEAALLQMGAWLEGGMAIKVSVNVSANHLLRSDFSDQLADALARHPRISPSNLELEVLETAAIADMEQAVDILRRCTALGVRFSLDDFGTGYSSLTYLRKLPVHTLKIDQSFVRNMLTDPEDLGIVHGVIELAAAFHRQVIAEGVETLAHGARLRELGCRFGQGYGIARPMPAHQLKPWCSQWLASKPWLNPELC
jgi:diguanylate cyclase (GGDEF)-like protein/PAS domain S-box-containing protein